jgi:cytoskeletal protein RodZ
MADQGPQQPAPLSELASFGEELRREREIRGISLKEIADATKISKRFLEAIERNDHKTLPAPVFTRGFVREYARYLGLNAEEMVNRYNYAAAGDDRIEKTPHLERLANVPAPEKKRGIPSPWARIDRNIYVTLLILIVIAVSGWFAVRYRRTHAEAETATAAAAKPPVRRAAVTPPPPAPMTPAPVPDVARLTIDVTRNSWVDLEADGQSIVKDELPAGYKKTFEAKQFRFRTIGNAAGVTLTLNDKQLPPLGSDGEVVHDRVFPNP